MLEPVRSAIGATVAANLLFNRRNVLAEGAADKPILEGAFLLHRPGDVDHLLISGSISETSGLLPRFYHRAKLPFVAFVDADQSGRKLKQELIGWQIPEAQIIDLKAAFDGKANDFELEDILSRAFYHSAVTAESGQAGRSSSRRTQRDADEVLRLGVL